jgi:F-type H+-transporting ATPase subunit delta
MRDIKVASRYAKSLLKIALEENSLEELHGDMVLVNSVCTNSPDLGLMLKSPIVRTDKKKAVLSEVFGKNVSAMSNAFISIILTKKREGLLSDIASAFIDIYKMHKNITTASITTAIEITKDQKLKIVDLLLNEKRDNIEIKEVVNPDIIGGMIIRIGDKQVDESIRRKLTNLEMEFDDNPYVKEY